MKRTRYFQWLDGELAGQVEVLNNITIEEGEYFYNFNSGESCNQRFISKVTNDIAAVKDKFMVEIASPNDPWTSEVVKMGKQKVFDPTAGEILVDVPPLEDIFGASGTGNSINLDKSAIGTKKFRAPKYRGPWFDLPSLEEYGVQEFAEQPKPAQPSVQAAPTTAELKAKLATLTPEPTPIATPKISTVSEADPVRILAKTCKKHLTPIELTLNINLPSKSIYQIAESEFENGGKNFVDCLVEDIDIKEIVRSISDALRKAYSEE